MCVWGEAGRGLPPGHPRQGARRMRGRPRTGGRGRGAPRRGAGRAVAGIPRGRGARTHIKYSVRRSTPMQVILRQLGDCIIRRAGPEDLIPVMEINLKTLPEHYSDYFYESLLAEMPESFIVAEIGRRRVGYIMCKTEFGFSNFKKLGFVKKGHMVSVAVLPEFRVRGIGRAIVEEAVRGVEIKRCDEFYLEVRCSNGVAIGMYERMGFSIRQRLGAYYRDGEDAYLMSREFDYG